MKWNIEYSRRANDFIEEHGIRDKVRDSIKDFILRITGLNINVDVKKLKGEWLVIIVSGRERSGLF